MSEAETSLTTEEPGRYGVMQERGRGGQSQVFLAHDGHVGRDVAFKQLLPHRGPGGEASVHRFLREARITGQLEHPNIIPVYEIGHRADGKLYYTMRLVHGRSLEDALKQCTTLQDRLRLLGHFADLCQAIAYAHSRGVVHRDIKPDNVMVGEFGETVVLDWGLAKMAGHKDHVAEDLAPSTEDMKVTMAGRVMGTPLYMSPEQARSDLEGIDEQSDVWGLGAVLYEILTGRPPVSGESLFQIIYRLINDPVVPVHQVCPEAPPDLAAVAERALQADKSKRYGSAREMLEEIDAFRHDRLVSAYHYNVRELAARFSKRYRTPLMVFVVLFFALMALGITSYLKVEDALQKARLQARAAQNFAEIYFNLDQNAGTTAIREKLLVAALGYYQRYVNPSSGTLEERRNLGLSYMNMGSVALDIGRTDEARQANERSLEILLKLAEDGSDTARQDLAVGYERLGDVDLAEGRSDAARQNYTRALDIDRALVERNPGNVDRQLNLATEAEKLGDLALTGGDVSGAKALFSQAAQIREKMVSADSGNPRLQRPFALSCIKLASVALFEGRTGEADDRLKRALKIARLMVREEPDNVGHQEDLASFCILTGNGPEAYDIASRLHRADPQRWTLSCLLAEAACVSGHYREAVEAVEETLPAVRSMVDKEVVVLSIAAAAEHMAGHPEGAVRYVLLAQQSAGKLKYGFDWMFYGEVQAFRHLEGGDLPARLFGALDLARCKGPDSGRAVLAALEEFRQADLRASPEAPPSK